MKHPIFPTSILIILVYVALALPFSSCEPDPGLPSTDSIVTVDTLPYNYIYKTYIITGSHCNMTTALDSTFQIVINQDSSNLNQVIISNFANLNGQFKGVIESVTTADSIHITVPEQYYYFPSSSNPVIFDSLKVLGRLTVYPDSIAFMHFQQFYDPSQIIYNVCLSWGHPQ